VEKQLVQHFPTDILARAHHWLILHGRYVCLARAPKCKECGLSSACKWVSCLLAACCLLIAACVQKPEIPTPKPKGYFRLTAPVAEYQHWDSILPFSFDYSKHATLSFQKKGNNIYWIDIYYPTLSAMFKMTSYPVDNNLHGLMWDEEQQVMFHVDRMMTDDIQYSTVNDPKARVFGTLYELQGKNVATPFKFWLTDSAQHFVKGTLYFDFAPNNDSLAPIIDYLKKDALFMVESWQWNKK
jgi:gliding motility-associated lipoprotein GldD